MYLPVYDNPHKDQPLESKVGMTTVIRKYMYCILIYFFLLAVENETVQLMTYAQFDYSF